MMNTTFHGFYNCSTVQYIHFSNTAHVTNMEGLFYGATNLISVEGLETDNVENMAYMFLGNSAHPKTYDFDGSRLTNISDIVMDAPNVVVNLHRLRRYNGNSSPDQFQSDCDLPQVRCFTLVYHTSELSGIADLVNCPGRCISPRCTTDGTTSGTTYEYIDLEYNVTSLKYAFHRCAYLLGVSFYPQTDATDTSYMFYYADVLNHPLNLDTSQVTDMRYMFGYAKKFNQPLDFDTSQVTDMRDMFYYAEDFDQPLNFTTTSQVKNMQNMFYYAKKFNQPLDFDTSQVTDTSYMFTRAYKFNQSLDFTTSQVRTMRNMFNYATDFNQPLDFNTSQVTDMSFMFANMNKFNQPLSFTTTSQVVDMNHMFYYMNRFNQQLNFDTSKVTNMRYMLSYNPLNTQTYSFSDASSPDDTDIDKGSQYVTVTFAST